jgi:hypothetical protein
MLALPLANRFLSCEGYSLRGLSRSAGIPPAVAGIFAASIARLRQLSCAHQDIKCVFEIFSESHNAAFVTSHGENLSASHIGSLEQAHDFVRHFRRAVRNGLRSCRNAIEKRPPQNRVVTMNDRRDRWIGFVNRDVRKRFR